MKRLNWKVAPTPPELTPAFPFAVMDSKGAAVALVKTKPDALFIAEAARKLSRLESDNSRHRAMYLGVAQGRTRR